MFNLNSKKLLASTATLAVALGAVAIAPQSAKAASFGKSWDNNDELCDFRANCSLQTLLDEITTSEEKIDTENDQSAIELFTPNASSTFTGSFMFEVAGNADFNNFGIYKKGTPGTRIKLFDGLTTPDSDAPFPTQATVQFAGNGAVKLGDTVYNDFGNEFGFYLETKNNIFYTEDALNENGYEQSVIYQGGGDVDLQIPYGAGSGNFDEDDWIIAFEDLLLSNTDSDYNDFVILATDLEAASTPEPATMAGLGLVGAAMLIRRRQNKKDS